MTQLLSHNLKKLVLLSIIATNCMGMQPESSLKQELKYKKISIKNNTEEIFEISSVIPKNITHLLMQRETGAIPRVAQTRTLDPQDIAIISVAKFPTKMVFERVALYICKDTHKYHVKDICPIYWQDYTIDYYESEELGRILEIYGNKSAYDKSLLIGKFDEKKLQKIESI